MADTVFSHNIDPSWDILYIGLLHVSRVPPTKWVCSEFLEERSRENIFRRYGSASLDRRTACSQNTVV
jgi:hypothetical protein